MNIGDKNRFNTNTSRSINLPDKAKNNSPKIDDNFQKTQENNENHILLQGKKQSESSKEKTQTKNTLQPQNFPFMPQWENKTAPDGTKELTMLFYTNGQNNLESSLCDSIQNLSLKDAPKDINLIIQLGRNSTLSDNKECSNIKRYEMKQNNSDELDKYPGLDEKSTTAPPLQKTTLKIVSVEESSNDTNEDNTPIIIQGEMPTFLSKPVLVEELPKGSLMKEPAVLKDFIQWGMKQYPAKHYMLIIQDHGGAWQGAVNSPHLIAKAIEKGVADSNEETGKNEHIESLIFNSFYMANVEALNELQHNADITVASENYMTSHAFGDWPTFISYIQKNISEGKPFDSRQFASDMVGYYRRYEKHVKDNPSGPQLESYPTITAIDNKKLGALVESWKIFNQICKKEGVTDKQLLTALKNAKNYPSSAPTRIPFFYDNIRDMGSIMDEIKKIDDIPLPVKKAASDVKKALKNTIINEQHEGAGMEGSNGLTIWGPTSRKTVDDLSDKYLECVPDFAENSGWLEQLKKLP